MKTPFGDNMEDDSSYNQDEDDDSEEGNGFIMVFLPCQECKKPVGCLLGSKPPKSCKEHH